MKWFNKLKIAASIPRQSRNDSWFWIADVKRLESPITFDTQLWLITAHACFPSAKTIPSMSNLSPKIYWHIHAFGLWTWEEKAREVGEFVLGVKLSGGPYFCPIYLNGSDSHWRFSNFLDRYCDNHNTGIEATCLSHGPTKLQRKGLFLLSILGWTDIIVLHKQEGKMLQWACLSISLWAFLYRVLNWEL